MINPFCVAHCGKQHQHQNNDVGGNPDQAIVLSLDSSHGHK